MKTNAVVIAAGAGTPAPPTVPFPTGIPAPPISGATIWDFGLSVPEPVRRINRRQIRKMVLSAAAGSARSGLVQKKLHDKKLHMSFKHLCILKKIERKEEFLTTVEKVEKNGFLLKTSSTSSTFCDNLFLFRSSGCRVEPGGYFKWRIAAILV
jgi:hypothetical protein